MLPEDPGRGTRSGAILVSKKSSRGRSRRRFLAHSIDAEQADRARAFIKIIDRLLAQETRRRRAGSERSEQTLVTSEGCSVACDSPQGQRQLAWKLKKYNASVHYLQCSPE